MRENEIREVQQHLSRLEEELKLTREANYKMQSDIEYEKAKNYPNREIDEEIARARANRREDNDFTKVAGGPRPWELERDRKNDEDRARIKDEREHAAWVEHERRHAAFNEQKTNGFAYHSSYDDRYK